MVVFMRSYSNKRSLCEQVVINLYVSRFRKQLCSAEIVYERKLRVAAGHDERGAESADIAKQYIFRKLSLNKGRNLFKLLNNLEIYIL